ncbi:hypothetical protein KIPB_011352, partial [Kipferlia bialata]|eukprot:g11352.t1
MSHQSTTRKSCREHPAISCVHTNTLDVTVGDVCTSVQRSK